MGCMEESELDDWFNEQKEMLEERFYAEAQKDVAAAKAHFDKDYKKLIREFQEKQVKIYEHKERAARLQKPIARSRELMRLRTQAVKQWWRQMRLDVKKWRFDRKIRRILKQR
jgi:hypothetical protein